MDIITIPASMDTMRKAYVLAEEEQHLLNFKVDKEVLPAETYETSGSIRYFYIKRHEVGEKHWQEGGYECYDSTGARRSFHLDSLIVHPATIDGKKREIKSSKRGRPKKGIIALEVDLNQPKRGRGRPRKDPSDLMVKTEYKPTGGKRGRPKKDPSDLTVKEYKPTGGKRGRPRKEPSELVKNKVYVPTGGKRGRPKKQA
jgi:hypothetical protein